MKRLVLVLILATLPGLLFAETVMLFTRMRPAATGQSANIQRFIAVEDGVEDQFYQAGHIIFDAGVPRADERGTTPRSNSWAKQVAKNGGADFLLIVNLVFPPAENSAALPTEASYRFVDLKTGSLLSHGQVVPAATKADLKSKKPYDLCFALGRRIAQEVMYRWQPSS